MQPLSAQRLSFVLLTQGNWSVEMFAGGELDYKLPVQRDDVRLTLETGPEGATIEQGRLRWRPAPAESGEQLHTFTVVGEGGCGGRGVAAVEVRTVPCPCGDHGECRGQPGDTGPPCSCRAGYSGMLSVVSWSLCGVYQYAGPLSVYK